MTCSHCEYAAKFHSYQQRRVLTAHGALSVKRAYYYCGRCKQSFIPYDDVLGLTEETARWRVFKARQKLLGLLAPQLEPEKP